MTKLESSLTEPCVVDGCTNKPTYTIGFAADFLPTTCEAYICLFHSKETNSDLLRKSRFLQQMFNVKVNKVQ